MSKTTNTIIECDRCGGQIAAEPDRKCLVSLHHPITLHPLDLCRTCEKDVLSVLAAPSKSKWRQWLSEITASRMQSDYPITADWLN